MPMKVCTLDALPRSTIDFAASVAPIEWPMTSILPVQDDAIALLIAVLTGVCSEPLWSLQVP